AHRRDDAHAGSPQEAAGRGHRPARRSDREPQVMTMRKLVAITMVLGCGSDPAPPAMEGTSTGADGSSTSTTDESSSSSTSSESSSSTTAVDPGMTIDPHPDCA